MVAFYTNYLLDQQTNFMSPNMVFDENDAIKSIRHKAYWKIIKKSTFNTFRVSKKVQTIVFDLIKLNFGTDVDDIRFVFGKSFVS